MTSRKRFYEEVSVANRPGGLAVLLDGKPIRTPAGAQLTLPTKALAEAVAEEWRGQTDRIRPESMVLTKLANTAIDRVAPNNAAVVEQILVFAKSDLVCYRADAPEELVRRQADMWDPLLDWVQQRYGAPLRTGAGIAFVEQEPEALDGLVRGIAGRDVFALAGLQAAAALLGSAVVALALADRRLQADDAFAAAQLDETYQAEKWGSDHEAEMRSRSKAAELFEIARFLRLLGE
jgi:chaperone required for assembly of F1-ATPase